MTGRPHLRQTVSTGARKASAELQQRRRLGREASSHIVQHQSQAARVRTGRPEGSGQVRHGHHLGADLQAEAGETSGRDDDADERYMEKAYREARTQRCRRDQTGMKDM